MESDREAAVSRCQAALVADPEALGLHYFLAFAYQARGEWSAAADSFEGFTAAAEADPGLADRMAPQVAAAIRSAALARLRAGEPEAAVPLLQRASGNDPADIEVWFGLGATLRRLGDAEGAEAAFRAAASTGPGAEDGHFFVGQLRFEAGDDAAAREHLERYLEAAPEGRFRGEAHWLRASIALRSLATGEADESPEGVGPARAADDPESERERTAAVLHFTAYLEALSGGPETAARAALAHYFLGRAAEEAGECAEARTRYEAFLELAPEDERAPEVRLFLEEGLGPCETPPPHGRPIAAPQAAEPARRGSGVC